MLRNSRKEDISISEISERFKEALAKHGEARENQQDKPFRMLIVQPYILLEAVSYA
jgi:hypothetical protein